jgi:CheY-like chemotaxis protein
VAREVLRGLGKSFAEEKSGEKKWEKHSGYSDGFIWIYDMKMTWVLDGFGITHRLAQIVEGGSKASNQIEKQRSWGSFG